MPPLIKLFVVEVRPGGENIVVQQAWEKPERRALQGVT